MSTYAEEWSMLLLRLAECLLLAAALPTGRNNSASCNAATVFLARLAAELEARE